MSTRAPRTQQSKAPSRCASAGTARAPQRSLARAVGNRRLCRLLERLPLPSDVQGLETEADRLGEEILAAAPSIPPADHPARAALSPMPRGARAFFEPRLGLDLSAVTVHSNVDHLRSEGAAAMTSGTSIAFAPGRLDPNTPAGRRLIAHELAHVLQSMSAAQRGVSLPRKLMKPDRIVNIQVNTTSRVIVFRIDDGTKLVGTLRKDAKLPPGRYELSYNQKSGFPAAKGLPDFTRFTLEKKDHERYQKLEKKISNVPMVVIAPTITSGKGGTGLGAKGKGVGADKTTTAGTTAKAGAGGGGGGPTEAEKKGRKFLEKVGGQTVEGVEVEVQKLGEQLEKLSPEEQEELKKFISETASDEGLDVNSAAELFAALTPEQREIMRANSALKAEGTLVTSPEDVTVAIQKDAQATQHVHQQAKKLNDSLAKIHDKVTDPNKKKDFEPIDLSKLKFFKEMMLLEGLLAGAASRSPEIGEIAKRLTTAIGEIRGWILEEIGWLAAEIAVGAIFSFITAGASLGVTTAVTGARVVLLLRRLNKLRQLIQKIESAYDVYQKITKTFELIKRASQAYQKFEKKYADLKAKVDALKTQISGDQLAEALPDDLEAAEDEISDALVEAIENDEVFGGILENFYLPPNLGDEELVQILMDIPKGVDAFKELIAYYPKVKSSDVEAVTVLSLKGVRAGAYLYPFVGYLADIVDAKLSTLVSGGDFGSRLIGLLPKGRKSKGKGKQKNKQALKTAQVARKEKRKEARAQRKKEREERRRATQEAEKKAKDKKSRETLANSKWKSLKSEIEGLESKYAPEGISKADLQKEVARIRGRWSEVAGKGVIRDPTNPGRWWVTVHRKGAKKKVDAKVLTTISMRQRAVHSKLRRKLDDLEADQRTRKKIKAIAETFKKPYGIDDIEVVDPKKDGEPFVIHAFFGKKKLEIGRTDVIRDHHTGSKQDPIPISWYKLPHEYPSSIELTIGGKQKKVKMTDTSTIIRHNGERVQVGVSPEHMVTKQRDLTRREGAREGAERRYKAALKAHGYDLDQTNESPDHVTDLAMGGPDAFKNLWPLDVDINLRGFGWSRDYAIEYLDAGKIKRSNIKSLIGKTFRVMSFDTSPKPPLGKGPNGGRKTKKGKGRR